jgi:3'-5' exoribonuclease
MITEYSGKIPGFPPELAMLLKHCILSHHGEYEYGSPKLPQLIEAVLLHSADNLDAKTKAFEEAISGDTTAGNWLKFNRVFQRNIRKSDYLQ